MDYIDNRNWKEYNDKLVQRGEFYLDLECVKNWQRELKQMNRKKSGAPYRYPNSFILFASVIALLLRRARDAELLDKNSIDDTLMELAKLRAVKVGGKWKLTEVSKKQRTIFEKLKIAIPVEANMVINKGGV